jgi:hypothetical protein
MHQPSSFPFFITLLGIPAAGLVAITFDLELSRLIYGQASPVLLGVEIASWLTLLALVLLLRSRLALSSAPRGLYRDVLDFLALARWHAAVKISIAGLLVLPLVWFVLENRWMFTMLESLGRRALALSDVQHALDGGAIVYQHALVGGLPLLFAVHMLCRWKPASRLLPWLLLPLFFVGTVVAVVVIVTVVHFSR